MKQNKNVFIGALASLLILGGIVWFAEPSSPVSKKVNSNTDSGVLAAPESSFDFGQISMAKGKVSHDFKIKNTGTGEATVTKIYTSCMCTIAMLEIGGEKWGPFGMPGHGFIPNLNIKIAPGGEAVAEAVFDPAAHGPAGVGKIERVVSIEQNSGQALELKFTAVVTP